MLNFKLKRCGSLPLGIRKGSRLGCFRELLGEVALKKLANPMDRARDPKLACASDLSVHACRIVADPSTCTAAIRDDFAQDFSRFSPDDLKSHVVRKIVGVELEKVLE